MDLTTTGYEGVSCVNEAQNWVQRRYLVIMALLIRVSYRLSHLFESTEQQRGKIC